MAVTLPAAKPTSKFRKIVDCPYAKFSAENCIKSVGLCIDESLNLSRLFYLQLPNFVDLCVMTISIVIQNVTIQFEDSLIPLNKKMFKPSRNIKVSNWNKRYDILH